jgi:hypothetical protein
MKTKIEKEEILSELLNECLRSANQDGSIVSLQVNPDGQTCTVVLSVIEVEEDDYVGFQGY